MILASKIRGGYWSSGGPLNSLLRSIEDLAEEHKKRHRHQAIAKHWLRLHVHHANAYALHDPLSFRILGTGAFADISAMPAPEAQQRVSVNRVS